MEINKSFKNKSKLRIIAVTGGKGGVGKTTISVNLAIAFAKAKKKVLLFDADLGLANVDILLGLNPEKNIHDFLSGECTLNELYINGPYGLKIIPSTSGIQKMAELSSAQSIDLIRSFSELDEDFDIMIIDMASGISTQVIDFTHASQDILVVMCNDPSSLMDSYAVIKILHNKYSRSRFGIIVNKVKDTNEGFSVFNRFQETAAKFMNISMHLVGCIPQDDFIGIAARERASVVDRFPHSNAAKSFQHLCNGIMNWSTENQLTGGIQFFFERLITSN